MLPAETEAECRAFVTIEAEQPYRICDRNDAFLQHMGFSPKDRFRSLRTIEGPLTDVRKIHKLIESAQEGTASEEEVVFYQKSGEQVCCRVSSALAGQNICFWLNDTSRNEEDDSQSYMNATVSKECIKEQSFQEIDDLREEIVIVASGNEDWSCRNNDNSTGERCGLDHVLMTQLRAFRKKSISKLRSGRKSHETRNQEIMSEIRQSAEITSQSCGSGLEEKAND